MPKTSVVLYCEADGHAPLLEWFKQIPIKAVAKCRMRILRLREMGHELRRPEADLLRDGIYELRVHHQGVHYRVLYFYHGNVAAVVSHGLTKERNVPPGEIVRALERKAKFLKDPQKHTSQEQP
jgi:phage-related protein